MVIASLEYLFFFRKFSYIFFNKVKTFPEDLLEIKSENIGKVVVVLPSISVNVILLFFYNDF